MDNERLKANQGAKGSNVPSHIDAFKFFCNPRKSTLYPGSISLCKTKQLTHNVCFKIDSLPLTYLGVRIFKGKAKAIYFQPIVDRVKSKISSLKASLLYIADRAQLINNVSVECSL